MSWCTYIRRYEQLPRLGRSVLLDEDLAAHLFVDVAEVGVGAGLTKDERGGLVLVEWQVKHPGGVVWGACGDGVIDWQLFLVGPGHGRARRDGQ